jgi:hypothetical protein
MNPSAIRDILKLRNGQGPPPLDRYDPSHIKGDVLAYLHTVSQDTSVEIAAAIGQQERLRYVQSALKHLRLEGEIAGTPSQGHCGSGRRFVWRINTEQ